MPRITSRALILFLVVSAALAQEASYYRAIQQKTAERVPSSRFKEMEEIALKNYNKAEPYQVLATAFGNTTERAWAVIYGEVYCNLSSEPEAISRMGSNVYQWYEESISKQGNQLTVSLTQNAESSSKQAPFESLFEQSFLISAASLKVELPPLTIRKLTDIRKAQLGLWMQKKLPNTELVRRQAAILSAGHFDAYNFWLFRSANAEEFNQWLGHHREEFQSWLDWQNKNKLTIQSPDFQRLHFVLEH